MATSYKITNTTNDSRVVHWCDKHKFKLTGTGTAMFEVPVYLLTCQNCSIIRAYKKTPVKKALLNGGRIRWYHGAVTWL